VAVTVLPRRFRSLPGPFKGRRENVPRDALEMFRECPEDVPVMLQRGFYF